jgi:hypothetical protein
MSDAEDLIADARASFEPWNDWDIDAILAATAFGGGAQGFGFRTRDARVDVPTEVQREILTFWYESLDRYRIDDIEVDCRIDGDVAVLWGFFTENFQHKGGDPESVRVRFSNVIRLRDGRWESVWNHRDIQDFTDEGFYISRPVD